MTSKIDGYGTRPTVVSGSAPGNGPARASQSEKPQSEKPKEAASGDSVRLTDDALRLQRLEQAVAEAPVADAGRVDSIRQAIASGEYRVDPERLATKIIEAERALAGR